MSSKKKPKVEKAEAQPTQPVYELTIRSGIPLPPKRGTRANKYPFDQMMPGNSFFVPHYVSKPASVSGNCARANKRYGYKAFVSRPDIEDGVEGTGVWMQERPMHGTAE